MSQRDCVHPTGKKNSLKQNSVIKNKNKIKTKLYLLEQQLQTPKLLNANMLRNWPELNEDYENLSSSLNDLC